MIAIQLIGKGAVGSALMRQFAKQLETRAFREKGVRVTAITGRACAVFRGQGFDLSALAAIGEGRLRLEDLPGSVPNTGWDDLTARTRSIGAPKTVMVDATAEMNGDVHQQWLDEGWHVVTANKHPLAGKEDQARVLAKHERYHAEATVGAGLPVLRVLDELLQTGDRVESVEGMLSGTLGFILNRCAAGVSFADAVTEAHARGFTEPDPREDLSGSDIARKALILGRRLGCRAEAGSIDVESLVPEPLRNASLSSLFTQLPSMSTAIDARLSDAAERGFRMHYLARITPERISVGLREVGGTDLFAGLHGPENMVLFRTERYREVPLVVRGPGAGAEVTAAGMFANILDACRAGSPEVMTPLSV